MFDEMKDAIEKLLLIEALGVDGSDDKEIGIAEKLQKVEALRQGATTEDEKNAAQNARIKLKKKLEQYQRKEKILEWTFRTRSRFEKRLLQAVLKRYGLRPYRYKRQKYTTVMAKMSKSVCEIVWSKYQQMRKILSDHLDDVTDKIIKAAVNDDDSPDEIREENRQITC